ncbi:MAG: hypothetical protein KME01_07940 [Chroococcus sp. CMT-3BRIN-NPC107]|jgi:hypothetical protein|nr:hypothetical protein [Chroococcus sp. CMT-3BRIN-NPC107]
MSLQSGWQSCLSENHTPYVQGAVIRQKISRPNDYQQAGDRYRTFEEGKGLIFLYPFYVQKVFLTLSIEELEYFD